MNVFIWPILLFLTITIQEKFVIQNKPKIYTHILLFVFLILNQRYEFALLILLGGVIFETSIMDFKEKLVEKRQAQRFRYFLFVTVIVFTFVLSNLLYNYKFFNIIGLENVSAVKITTITISVVVASFIKFKGTKWK